MQTPEIDEYGIEHWHDKKGRRHRMDGPAVICPDGRKSWCINGQFHRTDGPAVEYPDGRRWWYLNDRELTMAQYYFYNYLCKLQK